MEGLFLGGLLLGGSVGNYDSVEPAHSMCLPNISLLPHKVTADVSCE